MIDIFIPVKNRFNTLKSTLETCILFLASDRRLQKSRIIILDCRSSDIPHLWINSLPSFVVYSRTLDNLSMSANWERSFNLMTNPYFTFVGSDDGLIYNQSSVDKWLSSPCVDCFFWQKISFFWPDTFSDSTPACVNFPIPFVFCESDDILVDIFKSKIPWNALPCVYNSIVKSSFAKNIKECLPDELFFWNCVPDICSGINILKYNANLLYLPVGCGISGVSKSSNGYNFTSGKQSTETIDFLANTKSNSTNYRFTVDASLSPLSITASILLKDTNPPCFSSKIVELAHKAQLKPDQIYLPRLQNPANGLRARMINFLFAFDKFPTISEFSNFLSRYYQNFSPLLIPYKFDSLFSDTFNKLIVYLNFFLFVVQLWIAKMLTP